MRKKNKKVPSGKKPSLVLSRRAVTGWVCVIFFVAAWMFVIGVLVGRGTAPVKFNIDKLKKKLQISQNEPKKQADVRTQTDSGIAEDKTKLDFYEALKEDREDEKLLEKELPKVIAKKPESASEKSAASKKDNSKKQPADTETKTKATRTPTKKESVKSASKEKVSSKNPATSNSTVYTIQAASMKDSKDADRLVAKLKKQGYPAYRVIGKISGKGIWFRVRVGEYKTKAAARGTVEKLKKAGMKPIVVAK